MKSLFNIILFSFFAVAITSCGGGDKSAVNAPTPVSNVKKAITPDAAAAKSRLGAPQKGQMPAPGNAKMPWVKLGDVETLVKSEKKKILVDVYTAWCGPCKMMDRMTFTDQGVVDAVSKSFYPVKYNAEGPEAFTFMGKEYANPNHDPGKRGRNSRHQLADFFSVRGYPTMVVMDENMKIIDKIVGFKKPDQLLQALQKHL